MKPCIVGFFVWDFGVCFQASFDSEGSVYILATHWS